LTYDKYVDTNYLQQFLLTYRTFTTPKNFLALLIERYNVPNPVRASPEQAKKFQVCFFLLFKPVMHSQPASQQHAPRFPVEAWGKIKTTYD